MSGMEAKGLLLAVVVCALFAGCWGWGGRKIVRNAFQAADNSSVNGTMFLGELFDYSFNVDDNLILYWKLDMKNASFRFGLQAPQGWAGVAFTLDQGSSMVPSDGMIVLVQSSVVTAQDYDLRDYDVRNVKQDTQVGGQNNLYNVSGVLETGIMKAVWSRNFDTKDALDYVVNVTGVTRMVWAYDKKATPDEHDSQGSFDIDFASGQVLAVSNSKEVVHGWLMWVAWGVLAPIGMALSAFGKKVFGVWWFRLHIAILVVALALTIASFGVIVNSVTSHFGNSHARLGLAVFILALLQPFLGLVSHLMWDPDRKKVPVFPDLIHWFFGYVLLILAIIAIFLGFSQHTGTETVFYILFGINTGIIGLGFIIGWIVRVMKGGVLSGGHEV